LRELALHILDIAENSISAGATRIRIDIEKNLKNDILKIVIEDNGKGMDAETLARITDPFVTSRTTRKVGLGIPFFKAAAEACDGGLTIHSKPGEGTIVEVIFRDSHIDRMPLGDITSTLLTLMIGSPEVHWIFEYQINEKTFTFDDAIIKETLEGIPLSEPAVIKFIRDALNEGIRDVLQKNMSIVNDRK
jgi:anti-sigma regulatory factor (Ser/Thr protein kinase)